MTLIIKFSINFKRNMNNFLEITNINYNIDIPEIEEGLFKYNK